MSNKEQNQKRRDFVAKHFDVIVANLNGNGREPAIRELIREAREVMKYSTKTYDMDIWISLKRTAKIQLNA